MRTVKSINDVNTALKEVYDFIDAFKSRNLDLKGKRVANAGPSQDDYDYVIRKELYSLNSNVGEAKQVVTTSDQIEAILALISDLRADLTALAVRVSSLEDRVTALELLGVEWTSDIDSLQDRVTALEGG